MDVIRFVSALWGRRIAASIWRRPHAGFTVIELLLAVGIVTTLALIAYPAYTEYMDKAHDAKAEADISSIQNAIARYVTIHSQYPATLADVGMAGLQDPWGNPYQYLNIANATSNVTGLVRKDKNLVPLNTDYDLYSMGKDGASQPPLTAQASHDDIVRANNGAYVGLASDY